MPCNFGLWWLRKGSCGSGVADVKAMGFLNGCLVEKSFAVDPIPAIFAITTDPCIVFTVLGRRAMCFMPAGMGERFHLPKYGLAMVLVFVGSKMLIVDFCRIHVELSLGIVGLIIATFVFASLSSRGSRPVPPNAARERSPQGCQEPCRSALNRL